MLYYCLIEPWYLWTQLGLEAGIITIMNGVLLGWTGATDGAAVQIIDFDVNMDMEGRILLALLRTPVIAAVPSHHLYIYSARRRIATRNRIAR